MIKSILLVFDKEAWDNAHYLEQAFDDEIYDYYMSHTLTDNLSISLYPKKNSKISLYNLMYLGAKIFNFVNKFDVGFPFINIIEEKEK